MSMWGEPLLTELLAAGYLGLISLLWLGVAVAVPQWGARWMLARPQGEPGAGRVSVCIPARNEAHNIGACVRAALASRWPDLEVVVVDDRSEDDTADQARQAADGDERLVLISGSEPPAGWAGKPWACARAGAEASGGLLLFIDADVVIDPDAVAGAVAALRERQVAMLSLFGTWSLVSFWERAVIPAVGWLIRGAVDLDRVNAPGQPEAFANGQFILMARGAYTDIDGHAAVRDQVLDDVRLAEAVKRRGLPIALLVGPWAFRVRLYRSLREIVAGYGKNLYEGMGRRPALGLGGVLFICVGTLLPFAALLGGLITRLALGWGVPGVGWLLWLAGICALQLAFRFRLERRDGRDGRAWWTHPLANIVLVGILLRSVFGVEARWKGRRFVDGRASE